MAMKKNTTVRSFFASSNIPDVDRVGDDDCWTNGCGDNDNGDDERLEYGNSFVLALAVVSCAADAKLFVFTLMRLLFLKRFNGNTRPRNRIVDVRVR